MATDGTLRIIQLSDTHFLADGQEAEGGFGYDTDEAFAAVAEHIASQHVNGADLVVVTGDVADYGTHEEYAKAGRAFTSLGVPVNVCPGNHDRDLPFAVGLARPTVATSRSLRLGNWLFLFVDSNAGFMEPDETGRLVDPADYGERLHANGRLGPREAAWVIEAGSASDAAHIFAWVHHPPLTDLPLVQDADYNQEWTELVRQLPNLRGIGAGHTHIPSSYLVADEGDLPIYVGPSLKSNFDLTTETLIGPGYRTYIFEPDGSVSSEVHIVGEERWPSHPLPAPAIALFAGELTFDQYREAMAAL